MQELALNPIMSAVFRQILGYAKVAQDLNQLAQRRRCDNERFLFPRRCRNMTPTRDRLRRREFSQ